MTGFLTAASNVALLVTLVGLVWFLVGRRWWASVIDQAERRGIQQGRREMDQCWHRTLEQAKRGEL